MEGVSIIIPVFNKLDITKRCINHIQEMNTDGAYEIVIADNGSTDGTREALSEDNNIAYIRNSENLGLSRAYNIASRTAKYDTLCFMHNDVFIFEKNWTARIRDFIAGGKDPGVIGLYGAKTIRRDGSFRGKSIVHSIKNSPSIRNPYEKVAVIDGLLMAMSKASFIHVGGFSEVFSIHFYDKDLSLRAHKKGLTNYVLDLSFEHMCGTTRKDIKEENVVRESACGQFVSIWNDYLPLDVTTLQERLSYFFRKSILQVYGRQ